MKIRLSELRKIIKEEVAATLESGNPKNALYLSPEEAEKIRKDAGLSPESPRQKSPGTSRVMMSPEEVPDEIKAAREKISKSSAVSESAATGDPEGIFRRLMKTATSDAEAVEVVAAWDSLKSGTSFPDVAKELYDATKLNIAWIAKSQQGGPGLGSGPFDPGKLAAVESKIDASSMTGDDLLALRTASMSPRRGPDLKPSPHGPDDPGWDPRTGTHRFSVE